GPAATVSPAQQCRCERCQRDSGDVSRCTQSAFWRAVQERAHKAGALFILDENKTGFRMALPGAETFYGLKPDMVCYGKAIANGFLGSGLAGRAAVLDQGGILQTERDRVFLLSATHGGETHALAAALKTVEIMRRENVIAHLWAIGARLSRAFNEAARETGAGELFALEGYSCFPSLTVAPSVRNADVMRTLLLQEMARHGVLFNFVVPARAHDERAIDLTVGAAREVLAVWWPA